MENNKSEFVKLLKKKYTAISGHKSPDFETPEEYLQAICEYYENIIAILPNNVYWLDRNCILRGCNNNVAKLCNLPREKCIGLDYEQIRISSGLTKKQVASFKHDDLEVMSTGKPKFNVEEPPLLDKEGNPINCYISTRVPMVDKLGKIVGVVGISTDIIDRKRAEEIKHEAAQKVINFTNLMAGSMAHELRTPLQGISSQIDLVEGVLTSDKQTQQQKDEFLRLIAKNIKGVIKASTQTITDMLTKIRAFAIGQLPKKNFEERSIISDVEELLDNYPFDSSQRDLVKVSYGARFKYLGDKVLTNHLLTNLLKNALHAIKETDKPNADITIETKTSGDFNQLIFKDTSIGIPKDFVGKVFDQFETKKTTQGGTGLGLAFCKVIMEDYGGDITCNSEEGKYTEFVMNFPKLK